MRCFDPVLYQKYIDGELKERERVKLEKHLSDCKECKEFVERIKKEEIDLKGLFKEEDIDLTNIILERVYDMNLEKGESKKQFLYLIILLFAAFISSALMGFLRSIPFIGSFLSPLYYIPSIIFAILNRLQSLDFQIIFIRTGIISILIFALFLFKNLRFKMEV